MQQPVPSPVASYSVEFADVSKADVTSGAVFVSPAPSDSDFLFVLPG